jgi:recombination DNA repair RAD52 pathway protein
MADVANTFGNTEFTEDERNEIQQLLEQQIGPDAVSWRTGPAGSTVPSFVILPKKTSHW